MPFSRKLGSSNRWIYTLLPLVLLFLLLGVRVIFARDLARVRHDFTYLSPAPGARFVPAESTIALRPAGGSGSSLFQHIFFQVRGSRSGEHEGQVLLGGDEETIIFRPDRPFFPAEQVQVTISSQSNPAGRVLESRYTFEIAPPMADMAFDWPLFESEFSHGPDRRKTPAASLPISTTRKYVTAPADFPIFQVAAAGSGIGDGYIFLGYFDASSLTLPAYALILDNQGEPVYYLEMDPVPAILDFKVQPNGQMSFYNPHPQKMHVEVRDETYQIVNTYKSGNGYQIDLHDSYIIEDGRALLLAKEFRPVDMSLIVDGGDPEAIVIGCVIQEVDAAGNVLWQWLSIDHLPITDSIVDLTTNRINYIHCNSVGLDDDGDILLSSRHLSEVTKIDRPSGIIEWRLGGKGSDFTFLNDPHDGFYLQHDARRLANGNITVYDNRTGIDPSFFSRGVEYSLDEDPNVMEATMVWQYINTPVTYAGAMGNMQRLPGGNSLIGWGFSSAPLLTEVTPAGEKVFELSTAKPAATYRAFRYPWVGHPTWPPALVARPSGTLKINLYFSWNGATEIASYRLYGDTNPVPTTPLGELPRDGFETTFIYEAPGPGVYYFRVMPVDKEGQDTQYSPIVVTVASENPIMFPIIAGGN